MFDYIPPMFAAETADSEDEGDKWYDDHTAGRRPPELLPRDEVARSINSEVKAGRGSPHGGVFLDIATRRTAEDIRRRLPSMYHQFKELAGVDITAEAMEVGPTCHYIMGGVRVDADYGGHHGGRAVRRRRGGRGDARRQPAGRELPLRPPGLRAPGRRRGRRVRLGPDRRRSTSTRARSMPPSRRPSPRSSREGGENPYDIHHDLQATMQSLVGIIRTGSELEEAMGKLDELEDRARRVSVSGGRKLQPGVEPDHRPALHAHRVAVHHARGDQPQGEPGRAHPRRLSRSRWRRWARSTSSSGSPTAANADGAVGTPSIRSITVDARAHPGDARRSEGTVGGGDLMADENRAVRFGGRDHHAAVARRRDRW